VPPNLGIESIGRRTRPRYAARWLNGARNLAVWRQTMNHDALLLDLYACAAEPGRWPGVLDRLCAQTGARSAVVQAFSFDGPHARIQWTVQDSHTGRQQLTFPADAPNPRLTPRNALRGLNRLVRDDHLFDSGDAAAPRLQRQLATMGLGRFIGTLQEVSHNTYLGLALHRPVDDHQDFSAAQTSLLSALAPHVGQAFVLGDRLGAADARDARLRQHFDRLRCGLIICDGEARVQWLNRSAEQLLALNQPLQLRGGVLHSTGAGRDPLVQHIAGAAQAAQAQGVHYLRLGQGQDALHVAVQAMTSPSPSATAAASVLLVVTAANTCGNVPTEALTRLFGLTPAEARLVGAMVTGSTVEQFAQHRGVSVGTVRGQLKQVLAKTGVGRQADLVRLVLSSAAAQFASVGAMA
jgi:DNA-binding CsgD family transcriptional regulator/PAS domain-containing protein